MKKPDLFLNMLKDGRLYGDLRMDYKQAPVFLKARSIEGLAMEFADLAAISQNEVNDDQKLQIEYVQAIVRNASKIAPSVSHVCVKAPYDLKSEYLEKTRKAIARLSLNLEKIEIVDSEVSEYLALIHDEIAEFLKLLAKFKRSLDPREYIKKRMEELTDEKLEDMNALDALNFDPFEIIYGELDEDSIWNKDMLDENEDDYIDDEEE